MISLVGYTDRFSARPGESLAVKVSSSLDKPYFADLVRIHSADPNPAGPGMRYTPAQAGFAGRYPSRAQAIHQGSCGVVPIGSLPLGPNWTIGLRVQPWLLEGRESAVLSAGGATPLSLRVSAQGAVLHIGAQRCRIDAPMHPRHWYELRVIAEDGRVRLLQRAIDARGLPGAEAAMALAAPCRLDGQMVFGAEQDPDGPHYRAHFNGRLEHPFIASGRHDGAAVIDPARLRFPDLLAWWDFSLDIASRRISDRGPFRLDGNMVNLPTRAVRGPYWDGSAMNWRDRPDQYAAVHFHEDDLYDCQWETDFVFEVPRDLRSGVYGIRLRERADGGEEDVIPVFILPARGARPAPVALVMPTYTYQIYGNYDRKNYDEAMRARMAEWGTYPHHPAVNKQFGLSAYNLHADGSGVAYCGSQRPLLTMRPGYIAYPDARGSGLRHFAADMHIVAWMEASGIDYDILTDHDLETDGAGLLTPYKAVLTSTHPEYQSPASLDAFRDYIEGGGKLAYLGGNGFYWRVGRSEEVPNVLEVRRAENGVRSWVALPGEYYHALDGGYGGLWRNNGRAPQALVGVGFAAQGRFEGSYYRRQPASYAPDYAWLFKGIDQERIGDFGFSGGGAAGFELDRAEPLLGTPVNAAILCTSEGHQSHFGATLEELIAPPSYKDGGRAASLVRADMVYFELPRGGAVFAVGSITFCGSLPWNHFDNPVSTLMKNLVAHFCHA
ncbi:N,N-dimethylformamidase beta subunit family domain-containing protein [Bordetella hinzii]|uniref:N,N-dimethylformamidase beta subunit family domain-containing protein n=1 Tax=Bordetella hinzii TaxID=103855 RepID=UPI0039FC1935